MQERKLLSQFIIDFFLRSEESKQYNLTFHEVSILMALANRISNGVDCYPSQEFLSNYLKISHDTVLRTIRSLVKKNLVISFKKPSKNKRYTNSRHNFYSFSENVIVRSQLGNDTVIGRSQLPITVRYDANSHLSLGDMTLPAWRYDATSVPNRSINKSLRENRERETTLSLDNFEPNAEAKAKAKEKGLDIEKVKEKFVSYFKPPNKAPINLNFAFISWVDREVAVFDKCSKNVVKGDFKAITIDKAICGNCRRPEGGCRCNVSTRETAEKEMQNIMKKLKPNMIAK